MATAFDRWEKDPFFYAAEEVQESADRMESVYRRWMHGKAGALKSFGEVWDASAADLRRDLHATLGTAKWQLEELERAVRHNDAILSTDEATVTRHRDFIVAISDRIDMVEKNLKESILEEEGERSLTWVRLDKGERDEFALFLSSSGSEAEKVSPTPSFPDQEAGNLMDGETSVCWKGPPCQLNNLSSAEAKDHHRVASSCTESGALTISVSPEGTPCISSDEWANLPPPRLLSLSELRTAESSSKKVSPTPSVPDQEAGSLMDGETSVCWKSPPYQLKYLSSVEANDHRRVTSSCNELGALTISVSNEETPCILSDERANLPPPRLLSLSELRTAESSSKPKNWYRNGFRKWKAPSQEDMEETLPLRNHQLSRGMNACYEKSKSCISDCTDESYHKHHHEWLGALQRQLQRSQYQIQYGRPVQLMIWTIVTVLLIFLFVLRAS